MNVSIFHNMTSKLPLPGLLEGVANLIREDEKLATFTASYRQTGNKTFKNEAPLFAVACLFEGGKGRANVRHLTGLSLVDFDHIISHTDSTDLTDAAKSLAEMKAKMMADPHTLMTYITMSGNGLRVIFKYDLAPEFSGIPKDEAEVKKFETYYQQAFYAGNAYYEKLLGCKADMQCKNLTRLSGLAHDPEVFLRDPSEVIPFTAEEMATAAASYAKQSKEEKQMARIQTYFDTLIAPQLAKANIKFESGSHNEYVMRVGYRLAERRFSKKIALKWAVQKFGANYPDTEQVITSCYANATINGNGGGNGGGRGNRSDTKTASVEEIKSFLDGHVRLRMNEITSRVEYLEERRVKSEESAPSAKSARENWQPINDRKVNSLWAEMSQVTRVNKQDMYSIIESDYVPLYHPFKEYLCHFSSESNQNTIGKDGITNEIPTKFRLSSDENKNSDENEKDYIRELAATVRVKGGEADQHLWYRYLKKWLVAMVASWLSDDTVNNVILVLIGEQGAYKTTWFNYLLPPPLKQYFYTKTNANRMSKDDLLTLAQYGLVCCEELDTMRPSELNQLKAVVTMPSIDERAAYAHYHEHRKHIASFCGTGNNAQFLSDPTGNRRWLPFEVESIVSPREHPFDYEGIYAQALALYKSGFQYWFSKEEIVELNQHNKQFETPRLEHELVDLYFRHPLENETGIFMTAGRALQIIGSGITQKLSAVYIGRAFMDLGFRRVRSHRERGYLVVPRTAEEIKDFQQRQALEAEPDDNYDLPF